MIKTTDTYTLKRVVDIVCGSTVSIAVSSAFFEDGGGDILFIELFLFYSFLIQQIKLTETLSHRTTDLWDLHSH
jgi:hypothetical protein